MLYSINDLLWRALTLIRACIALQSLPASIVGLQTCFVNLEHRFDSLSSRFIRLF